MDAIHVEAKFLHRHRGVIDAARQVGVEVIVEPLTELLFDEGFPLRSATPQTSRLTSAS